MLPSALRSRLPSLLAAVVRGILLLVMSFSLGHAFGHRLEMAGADVLLSTDSVSPKARNQVVTLLEPTRSTNAPASPLPAECALAWRIIAVAGENNDPVIDDGTGSQADTLTFTTFQDFAITICPGATDMDGDTLDVTSVIAGPTNGEVTGLQDGDTCFTYIPDPGYVGSDTLLAVVEDGQGGADTVVVVIAVAANEPPIIVDGGGTPVDTVIFSTFEDELFELCLSAIDPEGQAVDITSFIPIVMSGSILGLGDDDTCITYSPFPNMSGTDTLIVVVCDVAGACDSVVVVINIIPVNDPPVITDPSFVPIDTMQVSTQIGMPVIICIEALDPDGDVLDVTAIMNGPSNGTADQFPTGDTCFTWTPAPGFIGSDTLTAVVCDGGGLCDSLVVIITVSDPNIPPIIVDGDFADADTLDFSTPEDTPIVICLTAIDLNGDTLDITAIFGGPLNGAVNGIADGDTCMIYVPAPDWNGTDTLSAIVCDGNGGCDTVLIIIEVTPVNDPPVITDPGFVPLDTLYAATASGLPLVICLEALDIDGDALDVTAVLTGPFNGTADQFPTGDTCFTWTPAPGYAGTDTLLAVVCDGGGACDTVLVIISVTDPNISPIIVDGNFADTDTLDFSTLEDTPLVICLTAIDLNGDTLDVTGIFGGPLNGIVTGLADGDTCITYVPGTGWNGTDTLNAIVCDGLGGCDTVLVIISVVPVNEPPNATDDTATTAVGEAVTIVILDNDSDPEGDPLTVTTATAGNGMVVINGDGTITYTPDPSFCGTDTILYTICDPGPLCGDAIVVVSVPCPPHNDPPIAVDDVANTSIGTSITVPVLENDGDPDDDPIVVTAASALNGTVVINGDGTITYTPNILFCGTDTIVYTVCDPGLLCDDALVVVTVPCPPANDPPVAVDDSATVDPGSDIVEPILVLANDSDPDGDPLTVTDAQALYGTVEIGPSGALYYSPDAGFCGTDTITYTVCDPAPLCDEAIVVVTVLCPDTTDLAIPEGFSPNNDGYGDTWTIAGLERYPLAKVSIINRWGNQVYSADPYRNDWDGRSRNGLTWDGALPAGTYWYVLDLGVEGEGTRTGYIYLNR